MNAARGSMELLLLLGMPPAACVAPEMRAALAALALAQLASAGATSAPAPRVIHGWRSAASALSRRSGSQVRQRATKSRNSSSRVRTAEASVLVPGRRRRPRELTTGRGAPVLSKKSLRREARSSSARSGTPSTSMMHASWSCSFSPGKMGYPVCSSGRMHPRLHMSIAML